MIPRTILPIPANDKPTVTGAEEVCRSFVQGEQEVLDLGVAPQRTRPWPAPRERQPALLTDSAPAATYSAPGEPGSRKRAVREGRTLTAQENRARAVIDGDATV